MGSKDSQVRSGLEALSEAKPRITEEFWHLLDELALSHARRYAHGSQAQDDESREMGLEFLLHLAKQGAALSTIGSWNDLKREYRRWVTRHRDPQGAELWQAVSAALLELARNGRAERSMSQRAFRNTNNTTWAETGKIGTTGRHLDAGTAASLLPKLSAKGARDRVLKPGEARTAVAGILAEVGGEISMGEIVWLLKPHVPMFRLGKPPRTDEEGDSAPHDPFESMAAEQVMPDMEAGMDEEVSYRSARIWSEAGGISRGTKDPVGGRHILCCYWIPTKVGREKTTLDQFGPTSTVMDVVSDLTAIMREYVPGAWEPGQGSGDRLACERIRAGIVSKLASLCSENGHCRSFYTIWDG
jgi:hypothetical protein